MLTLLLLGGRGFGHGTPNGYKMICSKTHCKGEDLLGTRHGDVIARVGTRHGDVMQE